MNVKVRIRDSQEPKGVPLIEWPIDRLDELTKLVESWGVDTGRVSLADDTSITGQFVVDDDAAYFELVVSGPGDDD